MAHHSRSTGGKSQSTPWCYEKQLIACSRRCMMVRLKSESTKNVGPGGGGVQGGWGVVCTTFKSRRLPEVPTQLARWEKLLAGKKKSCRLDTFPRPSVVQRGVGGQSWLPGWTQLATRTAKMPKSNWDGSAKVCRNDPEKKKKKNGQRRTGWTQREGYPPV